MPLKHLSTLFCDYLAIGGDGRHTLVGLYQNIGHVGEFPAVKLPFCLLVELQGEDEPYRITLAGPPGEQLLAEGIASRPEALCPYQQWATTFVMQLIPGIFPVPGLYSIVVYTGDTELHRRDFGVFQIPDAERSTSDR